MGHVDSDFIARRGGGGIVGARGTAGFIWGRTVVLYPCGWRVENSDEC